MTMNVVVLIICFSSRSGWIFGDVSLGYDLIDIVMLITCFQFIPFERLNAIVVYAWIKVDRDY